MLRSDLCGFSDAYIAVKGNIFLKKGTARNFINTKNRFLAFKTMHHLLIAYQRSIIYQLTMQKI